MRKKVFGRHFSRGRKAREALFRSLIKAVVVSGKITTTKAKAKAIQGQIDKMVSTAQENSLSARRRIAKDLGGERKLIEILFNQITPTFGERKSGFTRITLLPPRKGDNAQMARIEWVTPVTIQAKVQEKTKVKKIKAEKPAKKVTNEKKEKTVKKQRK